MIIKVSPSSQQRSGTVSKVFGEFSTRLDYDEQGFSKLPARFGMVSKVSACFQQGSSVIS